MARPQGPRHVRVAASHQDSRKSLGRLQEYADAAAGAPAKLIRKRGTKAKSEAGLPDGSKGAGKAAGTAARNAD